MDRDKMVLLAIKDAISEVPAGERVKIEDAAAKIRAIVDAYGAWGSMALALVGAEMAAA